VSLASLVQLLRQARDGGYGLLAFNVIPLEYAEAIVAAAQDVRAPVVLQVSQNAVRYHGNRVAALGAACRVLAEEASVPVALHLDHATTRELCEAAADVGFGSVMFDASALPEAANVRETAAAAGWAHGRGLAIEAEIGIVGGKDGHHRAEAPTEPEAARRFALATGVDALAVQVGSSHAMIDRSAVLDLGRIAAIRQAVPVPLVLHGSSGVPDDLLAAGVRAGLVKVNVGTRLNVAFSAALRARLATDPDLVDPRPYLADGRGAVQDAAAALLRSVGAAGQAASGDAGGAARQAGSNSTRGAGLSQPTG
jgi:fructose-bisphosphate aldolase class II